MFNKLDKIKFAGKMLFRGRLCLDEIRRRFFSTKIFCCFRRDLKEPLPSGIKNDELLIRKARQSDIVQLIDLESGNIDNDEFKERLIRQMMFKADINTCLVATNEKDAPLHIYWLISSEANEQNQVFFNGGFPLLKENELLIEGLYTNIAHRGKGVMSSVLFKTLEKGAEMGARWAIAFVRSSNFTSIKAFLKAGFTPFMIRVDKWRLFHRYVEYIPLSKDSILDSRFNRYAVSSKGL